MTKYTDTERREAAAWLRKTFKLKPGTVVAVSLKHVSRSGMTRDIAVYLPGSDGLPFNVSGYVATAIGAQLNRDRLAVRVGGVGMDMGFHVVYQLSRAVFADGFRCTGKPSCPANDHVNERGAAREAGYRRGRKHSDPGYALSHRWI
jgi:hypothetical protein